MSSDKPILILQMQRMGDLVMTWPLCGWLASSLPGAPIWVVGERVFFEGLTDISPEVTYFDYSSSDLLKSRDYRLIVNLSHRREAALLAGSLNAEARLGPYILPASEARLPDGRPMYIEGSWQLYRASINHNNRHNLFHWADLNAMDLVSVKQMRRTSWPPVKKTAGSDSSNQSGSLRTQPDKRVGLFLGASEPDKRPDVLFWAELAQKLLKTGTRPVLLGGEGDKALGNEVAARLKAPFLNLCGKFSIHELCLFMRKLELLIVPDTGPMHIAAWIGLPVLNLSMGPVNAWETGPFAPGHYVLRSSISCVGCWTCYQPQTLCKQSISADSAAGVAKLLLEGRTEALSGLDLTGIQLFRTARDEFGLFSMTQVTNKDCLRLERARFWKLFFGLALERFPQNEAVFGKLLGHARSMRSGRIGDLLLRRGQEFLPILSQSIRTGKYGLLANEGFWQSYPPLLRPLSSYLQLMLHNAEFSRPALGQALRIVEFFISIFKQ